MWTTMLLESAKTVVILILFTVVTDMLQQIRKHFAANGHLKHLILPDQPCLVLQYADNTSVVPDRDPVQV